MSHYAHLTIEDRESILRMLVEGKKSEKSPKLSRDRRQQSAESCIETVNAGKIIRPPRQKEPIRNVEKGADACAFSK